MARLSAAAALLLVVALVIWIGVRSGPTGAAGGSAPTADFVGTESCQACHTEEFTGWRGSQHARAMQHATEETVLGDFSDVPFTYHATTSRFFRQDGRFMVRTDGPDGRLADFEVKYTFGVSPLQQYLIELPGGRLQALSIAWDTRPQGEGGQRWFHLYPDDRVTHDDDIHWTGIQQNWNFMCADCHSTNLAKNYDAATDSFSTTYSEISVGCEACHGPGSRHVELARSDGAGSDGASGLTVSLDESRDAHWITDPETGTPRRSAPRTSDAEIQMCAQCHSRRSAFSDDYVPGDTLLDHYLPATLEAGLYHPDGQQQDEVFVHGSFLQSRMYAAGVTCSDCHDPHTEELRAPGNAVCARCHAPATYDTASHHFHPADGEGGACVSCHMPTNTYMVVDPRTDHSLRVPRPDLSVSMGVPNACTQCHTDRSDEWAATRTREWYGRDASGFQRFAEAFHADEVGAPGTAASLGAIADDRSQPAIVRASALERLAGWGGAVASRAARAALDDGDPQVRRAALTVVDALPPEERVSLAAHLLTDPVRAVRLQAVWSLAPVRDRLPPTQLEPFTRAADEFIAAQGVNADRPESRTSLGTFLAQLGRPAEAEAQLRSALRLHPSHTPAYVNLADLYRAQGREAEAERLLREGIDAGADPAPLHHGLGLSLARSGQLAGAVAELRRAAELAPENARFTYAYAVALHSSQRVDEAISVLERAHEDHPADRNVLIGLSTFHRDAGDLESARRYAAELVTAYPDDDGARQLLESLGG